MFDWPNYVLGPTVLNSSSPSMCLTRTPTITMQNTEEITNVCFQGQLRKF